MKKIITITFICLMAVLTSCNQVDEFYKSEYLVSELARKHNVYLKVDNSIDIQNALSVRSIDEFEQLIEDIKNLDLKNPYLVVEKELNHSNQKGPPCSSLSGIRTIRQPLMYNNSSGVGLAHAAEMYIQPTIVHNIHFDSGHVIETNSELLGITIGLSYNSGITHIRYAENGNVLIEFSGYLNWNIVFEGIGTVYREKINTTFEFECNI